MRVEPDCEASEKRKPGAAGSHTWFPWLRETHENSNYILLRIPIEISNSKKGQKRLSLHRERLAAFLGLSEADISRLCDCGLILLHPEGPAPKPKIDYEVLAASYRDIMAQMRLGSHAELARHLGVSRVWVSRVLKGIKRNAS